MDPTLAQFRPVIGQFPAGPDDRRTPDIHQAAPVPDSARIAAGIENEQKPYLDELAIETYFA